MLDIAEALNGLLDERHERLQNGDEEDEDTSDTTLQLVFFDGEEAFVRWTATDSIYGARCVCIDPRGSFPAERRIRHLADKWASSYIAPNTKRRLLGHQATELSTIEHLILLDLLGAPNPSIKSYFLDTAWLFDAMISAERRLGNEGLFVIEGDESMGWETWKSWFRERKAGDTNQGYMGDDHVPFLQKGVSVLHLIADPFPIVWHTIKARRGFRARFKYTYTTLGRCGCFRLGYDEEMGYTTACSLVRVPEFETTRRNSRDAHGRRACEPFFILYSFVRCSSYNRASRLDLTVGLIIY